MKPSFAKTNTFLFTLFFLSINGFSQSNTASTLLWRISGNGLTRPSYLYGTMHLTDKRVFQLGDSVYNALEQTEGFAAELDINRVGTQMINYIIAQKEEKQAREPRKLKDLLDAETWRIYKDALENKFNKKADRITEADLDEVQSGLESEVYRKGDMPSFLDAWLFGKAKNQGKWVGGVEDFSDQMNGEEEDDIEEKIQTALFEDKYYRNSLEKFIRIYTNYQLDSINAMYYEGKRDLIMIRRNLKMARRMDSLSAIRSTLFAVGVAHLPGDSGVIALLRSRGFTVTPVFSSKKINPDKYVFKSGKNEWETMFSPGNAYSLQMPGTPEILEMYENLGINMQVFYDLTTMKMYITMGIEIAEDRKKMGEDSMFNQFKSRYAAYGKIQKQKDISQDGYNGKEFRMNTPEGDILFQIWLPNMDMAVVNGVYAFNGKSIPDEETAKFFRSFSYKGLTKINTDQEWSRMDFPGHAFSVELPQKPKETKDLVSEDGKAIYNWQTIDVKNQVFYGINVKRMKKGMYESMGDSSYFNLIKDRLLQNIEESSLVDSAYLVIEGNPAFQARVKGKEEKEDVSIRILSVNRDGNSYYLYTVYQPSSVMKDVNRFFNSFKFIPYNYPASKVFTSADNSFSTKTFFDFTAVEDDEDDPSPYSDRWLMYDSLSGTSLIVDKTKLPGWLWYKSDTAFIRNQVSKYADYSDTMMKYEVSFKDGMTRVDVEMAKKESSIIKKFLVILNGDEVYEIFGYLPKQSVKTIHKPVFDDFKIMKPLPPMNRSASRSDELAEKLGSADKSDVNLVNYFWDELEFSAADIPALQKMALKIYPDFDSSFYGNLNSKIYNKLGLLDTLNETTTTFLINNYAALKGKDEFVKPFALNYISSKKTLENYQAIKKLLFDHPASLPDIHFSGFPFYDSLKLTATLFPEFMKLADKDWLWSLVTGTTSMMLDSNLISKSSIKNYGNYFLERAKAALNKEEEIENSPYAYVDLIKILGVIGSPEAIKQLTAISKINNREIRLRTLVALIDAGQPADTKTIYTLATTDEYRHSLYDELKRVNKLKLFPPEFLNQRQLGQSKLFGILNEDEEGPTNINFVSEKIINYKGKQQKFLLYKFSYDVVDEPWYLGVAGPYSLNPKEVESNHEVSGAYWDEEFDPKKTEEFLKKYLEQLSEDD